MLIDALLQSIDACRQNARLNGDEIPILVNKMPPTRVKQVDRRETKMGPAMRQNTV
jgi:hypothetical protein